jgi:hypothetical protein
MTEEEKVARIQYARALLKMRRERKKHLAKRGEIGRFNKPGMGSLTAEDQRRIHEMWPNGSTVMEISLDIRKSYDLIQGYLLHT